MNRLRIVLLCLIVVCMVSICQAGQPPQWTGAAPNQSQTFRFVVMSDNNGDCVPGEWDAAVAEINLLKPDFVMSVGDFIAGYTEDANVLKDRSWPEFDAMVHKLDAPFYYVPGNHDITNPRMRPVWLERYGVNGETYYSFDRGNCHFLVLDTATAIFDSTFMQQQLSWLATDLEKARDAAHLFVFYHHPQWDNATVWPALVKMLPTGKTTIFNGHWHTLRYNEPDGIPTYVLAATGASFSDEGDVPVRELGRMRMYTLVTVGAGRPTVAVLPLHNVLPGDYVPFAFVQAMEKTIRGSEPTSMPPHGGPIVFHYTNQLNVPLQVQINWNAPSWAVVPATSETLIQPGKTVALKFELKPTNPQPGWPSYIVAYATSSAVGKPFQFSVTHELGLYAEIEIPAVTGIRINGALDDWKSVVPYLLENSKRVFSGKGSWTDPADLYAAIRLGHDAERLYVCVAVKDDQIAIDGKEAWENDGVEFFWDSRTADKQDGKHGLGTGQVIMAVPAEGKPPTPVWLVGKQPVPKGLTAVCSRKSDGYVYEFSVPLTELGVRTPLAKDQPINIEFQLDDRDLVKGTPENSYMDTSGRPNSYAETGNYARCRLK